MCYRAAGWPGGAPASVAAALTALTWLATGLAVAVARPRLPFGWLLLGGGVCLAAGELLSGAGTWQVARGHTVAGAYLAWVGGWVFFPHLAAMALIYLLFPTGTLPSRRWRLWIPVTVAATALLIASQAAVPTVLSDVKPLVPVANPVPHPSWPAGLFPFGVIGLNLVYAAGLVALLIRMIGPVGLTAAERRSVRWVLGFAVVDQVFAGVLIDPPGPWVFALAVPATACMTVTIALGLIRHRLWGVRAVIGRALGFLSLSAVMVLVFAATLTVADAAFGSDAHVLGVPVAALIVCVGLGPVQRRVQAAVDRLVYGRRHQPYAVLSELGAALETAGEPTDALTRLTVAATQALRVPWVAIELEGRIVSEHGAPNSAPPLRLPLRHQGTDLGELIVAHRTGEARFGPSDRELLAVLARQTGAAAHAVALTAVGLTADVAADVLVEDPARGAELVRKARADVAVTLAEIRRVIDGLSPAVLAEAGLAGALADLAGRFDDDQAQISTDLPRHLPRLPAALEVAAFHIAGEALQNVTKHAAATRIHLALAVNDETLRLTVTDDGRGLPALRQPGIGMASMRDRAEDVGGTLTVEPAWPHGTLVSAVLPMWKEDPMNTSAEGPQDRAGRGTA